MYLPEASVLPAFYQWMLLSHVVIGILILPLVTSMSEDALHAVPDALREASYFVERLAGDGMPLAGLVLNRVHTSQVPEITAEQSVAAADHLAESPEHAFASAALLLHAERMRVIERERRLAARFSTAHPSVATVSVPAFSTDVHDLDGLRAIAVATERAAVGRRHHHVPPQPEVADAPAQLHAPLLQPGDGALDAALAGHPGIHHQDGGLWIF